ncbi:MAG: hypothetical protein COA79_09045 [Planctomycetota bacterium]|nr:MAG: hypothetical protein COA79_09045 [Planctomycetota bacterium]
MIRLFLLSLFFIIHFNVSLFCDSSDPVFFYSQKVTIEYGETSVIPFYVKTKVKENKNFSVSINKDFLKVLYTPAILKSYQTGYIRVKALKIGKVNLKIGSSSIIVNIAKSKNVFSFFDGVPQIITPIQNAVVNGKIAIGVKVLNNKLDFDKLSKLLSLTVNDKSIKPEKISPLEEGPTRIVFYTFDMDTLPAGEVNISAKVNDDLSNTITIHRSTLKSKQNKSYECENQIALDQRLEKWGKLEPKLGSNPDASGGKFIVNYATDPVSVHGIDISENGFYQFIVRARGDRAGGAYPTVGIYIDGETEPSDMGRTIASSFHRVILGNPIYLKKGSHQIALRFMNDFWVKEGIDRNLYLDNFEIIKVNDKGMNKSLHLKIAFQNNFHNNVIRSDMRIPSRANWDKKHHKIPPIVSLEVNGVVVSAMQASESVFHLERDQLKMGKNSIKLYASFENANGIVSSTTQDVFCFDVEPKNKTEKLFYEFRVHDKGWKNTLLKHLINKDRYSEEIKFTENAEFELELPEDIEGEFEVMINSRGGNHKEAFTGLLSVKGNLTLKKPAAEKLLTGWWRHLPLGKGDLKKGKKSVKIKLSNEKNKASLKPLFIKGVILKRLRKSPDRSPPSVTIIYPPKGMILSGNNIVVVRVSEDRKFTEANLFINGKNYHQRKFQQNGFGLISFVLPQNALPKGKCDLMIRVNDSAGNIGESRRVVYENKDKSEAMNLYERAVHLSKRLGYGAGLQDVSDIIVKGEDAWLEEQLSLNENDEGVLTSLQLSDAYYNNRFDYNVPALKSIVHLTKTQGPLRARFVMWAENHFSTWINKVQPQIKIREHQAFLKQGIGSFKNLLLTSAFSPAMINYLDQQTSYAGRLNENYARELLELHTLSVNGGYLQEDVTKLAGLLNGWLSATEAGLSGGSIRNESFFYFVPSLNDGEERSILGLNFKVTSVDQKFDHILMMLEMLAAHPATAKFIVKKFVAHYTGESAAKNNKLRSHLENSFLESGGDMKLLLREIIKSKSFWEKTEKVYTPLDYSVALGRNREAPNFWAIHSCARKSGVGLYDRATPDGYPEGNKHYADSNSLLQRWRFCEQIKWNLNVHIPNSLHQKNELEESVWSNRVVQTASMNMLGRSLKGPSLKASRNFLIKTNGQPWEKILKLVTFIGKLPEANLR